MAAEPDPNAPHVRCRRHPNGTDKPCRECQADREADEAEHQQQLTAKKNQRAAFWAEVRKCPDCDDHGMVDNGIAIDRCTNHAWELVHD